MTYYVQRLWQSSKTNLARYGGCQLDEHGKIVIWVGDTVGQRFNGTFNLNLKMSLVQQDGVTVLSKHLMMPTKLRELIKVFLQKM